MKDTSHQVQQILRAKLRSLTPEARIRMATGMFSAARELGRAGAQTGRTPAVEQRRQLLVRLYSAELSATVIEAAARRLSKDAVAEAPGEADPVAHDAGQ